MGLLKWDEVDDDLVTIMSDAQLQEVLRPAVARKILLRRLGFTPDHLTIQYQDGDTYNLRRSNLALMGAHKDSVTGVAGVTYDPVRQKFVVTKTGKRHNSLEEAYRDTQNTR